jgi:hypothetical protein
VVADPASNDLDQVPDPDDTGSDTFKRYRYQAEAAFTACLDLALVQTVVSITPERIEDLLIEQADRWRFIQIKTRDPGLNAFTFAELLGDGGALRSVARTHEAVGDFDDGRDIRYEIWLERGARTGNAIERLLTHKRQGPDSEMVELCAKRLKIEESCAEAMLDRCDVRAPLPPRDLIRDSNIRNLQRFNPTVSAATTVEVYEKVIDLIETAMRAELLQDDFPSCLMDPGDVDEALAQKIAGKRLDASSVEGLFEPIKGGNTAVLEQITDPDQLAASELDRKLVAAGVAEETRQQAKVLRANASQRVYELSSGLSEPGAQFGDLDIRALTVANASAGTVTEVPPGPTVFKSLLDELVATPEAVDPKALLSQDPMLLLGRICELSDQCRFGWGNQ